LVALEAEWHVRGAWGRGGLKRVAAMPERPFLYAGTKTRWMLGNVRHLPFGKDGEDQSGVRLWGIFGSAEPDFTTPDFTATANDSAKEFAEFVWGIFVFVLY
jgi:hypothetical protein